VTKSYMLNFAVLMASLLAMIVTVAAPARAHELEAAIMDVDFMDEPARLDAFVELNLEAFVAGVSPEHENTNDSPEAAFYNLYRKMAPEDLARAFEEQRGDFEAQIMLEIEGKTVPVMVTEIIIPEVGNLQLARASRLRLAADLPEGTQSVQIGWAAALGDIIVRTATGEEAGYAAVLKGGTLSDPINVNAG